MITKQQASALAFLLHEVRPDWHSGSLMKLFEKHVEVSIADLTIAAMTKAREPSCVTPQPIFMEGPHWPVDARVKHEKREYCEIHYQEDKHRCRCCAADRIAETKPSA